MHLTKIQSEMLNWYSKYQRIKFYLEYWIAHDNMINKKNKKISLKVGNELKNTLQVPLQVQLGSFEQFI